MADLHWPYNFYPLFFKCYKTKFILWGSWLTKKPFIDFLKVYLANCASANILYCLEHKKSFIKLKVPESKLFVANNTIDVGNRVKAYHNKEKFRILFVGTLNARKQNIMLLYAFKNIINLINENIYLTLIGEGKEKEILIQLVNDFNITNRVSFEGAITEPSKLITYYSESIVSVSYGQAGLSVLQSLGFGVPFITKFDAISGGEKTNIINGYNGFLCDGTVTDLEKKLLFLCSNVEIARRMGKNAYNYYTKYCTIEIMAKGFKNSIY